MMRVGLVGMERLPEPDVDEAPALGALAAAGIDASVVHWGSDHPDHDPGAFDLCVLRATWDYYRRPDEFLAWLRRAERATRLCNPAATVEWNLHKRYLLELERAGVPIIPTVIVERGALGSLDDAIHRLPAGDLVLKPAVSAASWKTRRFEAGARDEAAGFLLAESAARDFMIQPYMREVERAGEISVIAIDGETSHAVRKAPRFDGHDERIESAEITPGLGAFAQRTLDAASREAMYARIDVVPREDGSWLLSELELIEPSLYFPHSAAGLARFIEAVRRRLA